MNREKIKLMQNAQFDILMYIHDICGRLDIPYFLSYGTLLGAIRHAGPIPWDADIDVALFRDDYEKLKEYLLEHGNQRYFYSDYTTYKHHVPPHAVLIDKKSHIEYSANIQKNYKPAYDGVYIDIFPIDRTSPDRRLQKKQAGRIIFIRQIISYKLAFVYEGKTGFIKKTGKQIFSFLLKPLTLRFLGRRISKIQQQYDKSDSDRYVVATDVPCFDRIVPIDYYLPPRAVLYSGKQVFVPSEAEELLKLSYGNYMELPPDEERWNYTDNIISDVRFDP